MIQGETDRGAGLEVNFLRVVHLPEKKAVGSKGDRRVVALPLIQHPLNLIQTDPATAMAEQCPCQDADHVMEKRTAGNINQQDALVHLADPNGIEGQPGSLGLAGSTPKGLKVMLSFHYPGGLSHGIDIHIRGNHGHQARSNGRPAVSSEEMKAVVTG